MRKSDSETFWGKHVGAELILGTMFIPFLVWMVTAIFSLQSAGAVQETKYQAIIDRLDDIKKDVYILKTK